MRAPRIRNLACYKPINRLVVSVALISFACILAIESLHGHACAGEGCTLCTVAALAQCLLGTCFGITLVSPTLRAVASKGLSRAITPILQGKREKLAGTLAQLRVAASLVTLGVRLLI